MTLDENFLIGLIAGAVLAWILHWLIYRDRTGAADHAHDDHGHGQTASELKAAQAEIATLKNEHEAAIASCEEKLADAEAELRMVRADLESAAESFAAKEAMPEAASPPPPAAAAVSAVPATKPAVEPQVDTPPASPPPAPAEPDDLKKIEGIGPKIEKILHDAGIKTFAKLAGTSVAALEKIVREDGGIRVAYPDTWPQQAGLAAAAKWDELERLQDSLKGGRKVA